MSALPTPPQKPNKSRRINPSLARGTRSDIVRFQIVHAVYGALFLMGIIGVSLEMASQMNSPWRYYPWYFRTYTYLLPILSIVGFILMILFLNATMKNLRLAMQLNNRIGSEIDRIKAHLDSKGEVKNQPPASEQRADSERRGKDFFDQDDKLF